MNGNYQMETAKNILIAFFLIAFFLIDFYYIENNIVEIVYLL